MILERVVKGNHLKPRIFLFFESRFLDGMQRKRKTFGKGPRDWNKRTHIADYILLDPLQPGTKNVKILALIGSPRKGSNTDLLVDQILKGAEKGKHQGEKIYLYAYKILPCMDCRACKKGDYVCPLNDEMQKIYPKMEKADLIIFGTPNYWYGPTGKMKLLIDRMRPFVPSGKLKGKKWVVVSPSAEGPNSCRLLVEMIRLSCDYLGMKFAGKVLAKAYEKGEIRKDQKALRKAFELGMSL